MAGENRDLTDQEMRVYNKIIMWEKLYSARCLTATVFVTVNQYTALRKMNIVNPIKIEYRQDKCEYELVMTLADHWRYVAACCKIVGLTVDLEGTIRTQDNLIIHRHCEIF